MANINWIGGRSTTRQLSTYTVTAVALNGTLTLTVGGRKSVTYTCSGTDTTTTAATALYNLLTAAQGLEGEWSELTLANPSAGVITLTGPTDGAPVMLAKTDASGATSTLVTTTAATSPHDLGDAANWGGGVLPGNTDTAVFENGSVDALYNLAALTAVTFGVIRRASFTGRIGLSDTNATGGYAEYRPTYLETAGISIQVEQANSDSAAQVRIKSTGAAATVTVTGSGATGSPGSEPVEVTGLTATSVVNVSAAGVAVAPLTGQTAAVTTLLATSATVRCGPGVTLTTATLTDCQSLLQCGYTTLEMDRGGQCEVDGSGSGTTTNVDGGTLLWRSTGNPGAVGIGSDGTYDLSQAPAKVTSGTVSVYEGGAINDPAGRLAAGGAFTLNLVRTEWGRVSIDLGTGRAMSVTG